MREYGLFPGDVPAHDTLSRFWRLADPTKVGEVFRRWMQSSLSDGTIGQRLQLDGKTIKGTADGASKAVHVVEAYASEMKAVLGLTLSDGGVGGEKAAAKELLQALDLNGLVVTADAGFAVEDLAQQIVDGGGTFLVGLKQNQPTFYAEVDNFMTQAASVSPEEAEVDVHQDEQKPDGHGRVVSYHAMVCKDLKWMQESLAHSKKKLWPCLRSAIAVERSVRQKENGKEKLTVEKRYYLATSHLSAKQACDYIQGHWRIEGDLHQTLDVTIQEDAHRARKDHTPINMAFVRRTALNIVKQIQAPKTTCRRFMQWIKFSPKKYLGTVLGTISSAASSS